jgi:hypothetical protein
VDINPIIQAIVQSLAREITPLVLAEVKKTIGEQPPALNPDEVLDRVADQISTDLDMSEVADNVARKLYVTAADVAEAMDAEEVAENVAQSISARDVSEYFNIADIAEEIGADEVASHVDLDDLAAALVKRLAAARLTVSISEEGQS